MESVNVRARVGVRAGVRVRFSMSDRNDNVFIMSLRSYYFKRLRLHLHNGVSYITKTSTECDFKRIVLKN